jgi:HEPN domain-containing protein
MNKADLVKEWFDIASDDLRSAAFLFENLCPKPIEIVCYHCQQAVEKAMKGYLINHDIEPPYIHDLEKLRKMCIEFNPSFETIKEVCLELRGYAASARYPNFPEITEADAASALKEAEKIYAFCAELALLTG